MYSVYIHTVLGTHYTHVLVHVHVHTMCVCVCVCVCTWGVVQVVIRYVPYGDPGVSCSSEFLADVEPFLHVPEEYVSYLVTRVRQPYYQCLQSSSKRLNELSTYQTLLGAIQEVNV